MGFNPLGSDVVRNRTEELKKIYPELSKFDCKNDEGQPMDALYIPSQNSSGNLVIFCLHEPYAAHHLQEKHLKPFTDNQLDVLLWDPIESPRKSGSNGYATELTCLLKQVRDKFPDKKIVLKTHCATSDPSVKAATELQDSDIHIIIDRGYGNIQELAQSFICIARCKIIKDILRDDFDCEGESLIPRFKGKVLSIMSPHDQIAKTSRGTNLTEQFVNAAPQENVIKIGFLGDHWAKWDYEIYNGVLAALVELDVIKAVTDVKVEQYPSAPPLGWVAKKIFPIVKMVLAC